jgi:hypothetical protein
MKARSFPVRTWIVFAAALAIGAAACGTGNLDKAGGPVSKPVVLTLAELNGFEGHANLSTPGSPFRVPS